jgi:prevent-host-death family protein
MQNIHFQDIDVLVNKILPLTQLRRNPSKVLAKLEEVGGFIITKDGKPVGKLLPLKKAGKELSKEEMLAKIAALSGGFKIGIKAKPSQIKKIINQNYEKMLP